MSMTAEEFEIGRKAVEDALVEWRDNRLSTFNRGNGLVIKEKDGRDSHIIRFGMETALKIALEAITKAQLAKEPKLDVEAIKREERERIETKAMEWVDKEIQNLNMNHLYKDMLRQALRGE